MSIKVGKQYKDAFKSICNLYRNGAVNRDVIQSIEGNTIKLANAKEFEYVETDSPNRGTDFGMTKRGASWFAGFRDETIDDSDSSWKTLIENVAQNYHDKYSFVEFKEKTLEINEEDNQKNKEMILTFTKYFFDELTGSTLLDIEKEDKNNIDDIYCASLKMAVDNGSGEAKIVLAKLFFRQFKKTLVPLITDEAREVQNYINDLLTESSGDPYEIESNKIDAVVGAVENVIKNDDFDNYFTLSSLDDEININNMVEKGPNDEVELNCRSVKVLGISHIRWNKNIYLLKYHGKPLLKYEVGISKKLSCYCINCGNEILVSGNQILMKNNEKIKVDLSLPEFGLTNKEKILIETESILSDHVFGVSCLKNRTKRTDCSRICCISQVETINGEIICKKCPYPEILFIDNEGKYHLTKDLVFTRDTFEMKDRSNTKICSCCGRVFTLDGLNTKNTCSFCNKVLFYENSNLADSEKSELTKKYKKYSTILPLRIRVGGLFKKKYCFEQEDILLFVIGKNIYKFDKLKISDKGYIEGLRKIR